MNTNNAIYIFGHMVGVEVENIQDVVKAQEIGFYLSDEQGNGYDYTIMREDEEGNEVECEPTEQEIFERVSTALADGEKVYACMTLSPDWDVQRHANTHLKTNFYVGQQVFTMRDNKIAEKTISRIIIEKNEDKEVCKLLLGFDSIYTKGVDVFATKEELVESLMKE
jgi:hypothetical protein